jgi:hypothetical protein
MKELSAMVVLRPYWQFAVKQRFLLKNGIT